ncbi:MAG: hypothetical protein AB9903_29155 [Vulcanimicrobiota bacterium]
MPEVKCPHCKTHCDDFWAEDIEKREFIYCHACRHIVPIEERENSEFNVLVKNYLTNSHYN